MQFKNGKEMYEYLVNNGDLYSKSLETYVFAYNDADALCIYNVSEKEAVNLAKESKQREEKWSGLLGPGGYILDEPKYDNFRYTDVEEDRALYLKPSLDFCNEQYQEEWIDTDMFFRDYVLQMNHCYHCEDLFAVLGELIEYNVKHYKSDFEYDKKILKSAVQETEKDFIWFTRDNGTQCVNERLAYIDGTFGHAECSTFLGGDSTKAYYVHVDGRKNGKVSGSVYPVDHMKLYNEIMENKVPAHQVKLTPREGEPVILSYEKYNRNPSFYYKEYDVVRRDYLLTEEHEGKIAGIINGHKIERGKAEEKACHKIPVSGKGFKEQTLEEKISSAKSGVKIGNVKANHKETEKCK